VCPPNLDVQTPSVRAGEAPKMTDPVLEDQISISVCSHNVHETGEAGATPSLNSRQSLEVSVTHKKQK
jgi:hypothetical protein